LIIDTDVLIWSMRGYPKAARAIEENSPFSITWVSYMELIKGVRDKRELDVLTREIQTKGVRVIHASEETSALAVRILKENHLANSMDIADAINAAIAISHNEPLLSANRKHYAPLKGLRYIEYQPT
jgi:predicted nucleic acid-binding protein